jgi:hypothetical protein
MKKLLLAALALALALTLLEPALAHGNMDHILGTVSKISGNVVSVSKDGQTTDVLLNDKTTWEEAGKASQSTALRLGDRVVIHAVKVDGKEVAHDVRFTHPAK